MSARPLSIEITGLAKAGGELTKRLTLRPDGSLRSDGSACVMSAGTARRMSFDGLADFARCIGALQSNEAIALGALREDLPQQVEVITKSRLAEMNGHAPFDVISRSSGQITYRPGQPALALIDYDVKAMPASVKGAIERAGGFWSSLVTVLPELARSARLERTSTSSGITRSDTGVPLVGSGGVHVYLMVRDGTDIPRFLRVLHARCWLQGYGWLMVGAGGQLLERSIVDRSVGAPERLVFEAAPILTPPLIQDATARTPIVTDGQALDTRAVIDLTMVEQAYMRDLRAAEAGRLAPAARAERETFVSGQAARIVMRTGCSPAAARQTVERQCDGILLPHVELTFDGPDLAGKTVADVLADPEGFEGVTLSDPLEGPAYGISKAMVMRRPDGSVWIHSFAHGRTVYELRHDAAAIEKAMRTAPAEAADVLVRLAPISELASDEDQTLRDLACELCKAKARPLAVRLKAARLGHEQKRRQTDREVAGVGARDKRLRLEPPDPNHERLPIVTAVDDVLFSDRSGEPPTRDIEGRAVEARSRHPILLHAMMDGEPNEEHVA